MKTLRLLLGIVLFFISFGEFAISQIGLEPIKTSQVFLDTLASNNTASLMFDKSLNRYFWNGKIRYANSNGIVFYDVLEYFRSTLTRTNRNLIRDEQTLEGRVTYRLSDYLQSISKFNSFILSDNQNIGINSASAHGFYMGTIVQPSKFLNVSPLIGMRFDNQIGEKDKGPSFLASLESDGIEFSGFQTSLRGNVQYDWLDPRRLETIHDTLQILKYFHKNTHNTFQLNHSRIRREFYLPSVTQQSMLGDLETRTEDGIAMLNSLKYSINDNSVFSFYGSIYSREINRTMKSLSSEETMKHRFSNVIEEMKLEGKISAEYKTQIPLTIAGQIYFQEREQQHLAHPNKEMASYIIDSASRAEERKSNHARRTSLALLLYIPLSNSDSIFINGSSSLLRYDTPSQLNDDDRDELWYLFILSTWHRINPYLILSLNAQVNLTHQVYLFATRSADNSWNRVFKLSPVVKFVPSRQLASINRFDVIANYTVYDYESQFVSTRSYSFREFSWMDSSQIQLTKRLMFKWSNQIRYTIQGEFYWEVFSERPIFYSEDFFYHPAILYQHANNLYLSIGFRYFKRSRFVYTGSVKKLENVFRSLGPVTELNWNITASSIITANGWYEMQKFSDTQPYGTVNLAIGIIMQL